MYNFWNSFNVGFLSGFKSLMIYKLSESSCPDPVFFKITGFGKNWAHVQAAITSINHESKFIFSFLSFLVWRIILIIVSKWCDSQGYSIYSDDFLLMSRYYFFLQDSIEEINLSSNNISDLGSGSFGGLVHLRRVDLRANSLATLPQGTLKINPMAGQFGIRLKNPFSLGIH